MKRKLRPVFILAVLYLAAVASLCVLAGLAVIESSDRFIPLFAVAVLLFISGVFAAASAGALVRQTPALFIYYCFGMSWVATVFVTQSVYVCLSCTGIQNLAGSGAVVVIPFAIGFILIKKAERVRAPHQGAVND